jgi:predicted amino acid racemase
MSDLPVQRMLIAEPALSNIEDVIRNSEISLNSEFETLDKLNDVAKRANKTHKVILMYELGDCREGSLKDELFSQIEKFKDNSFPNLHLLGIGTNLTCHAGVMPDEKNMKELTDIVDEAEEKFDLRFDIISGGNSSSYKMLKTGTIPKKINQLRFGDAILRGFFPGDDKNIEELNYDNYKLEAEIVELKQKPTVPSGEHIGFSALGNDFSKSKGTSNNTKTLAKRAIINVGHQDIDLKTLTPLDNRIEIVGGSTDYIILDVTNSLNEYKVGDIVTFDINYIGTLQAFTSNYVSKKYLD